MSQAASFPRPAAAAHAEPFEVSELLLLLRSTPDGFEARFRDLVRRTPPAVLRYLFQSHCLFGAGPSSWPRLAELCLEEGKNLAAAACYDSVEQEALECSRRLGHKGAGVALPCGSHKLATGFYGVWQRKVEQYLLEPAAPAAAPALEELWDCYHGLAAGAVGPSLLGQQALRDLESGTVSEAAVLNRVSARLALAALPDRAESLPALAFAQEWLEWLRVLGMVWQQLRRLAQYARAATLWQVVQRLRELKPEQRQKVAGAFGAELVACDLLRDLGLQPETGTCPVATANVALFLSTGLLLWGQADLVRLLGAVAEVLHLPGAHGWSGLAWPCAALAIQCPFLLDYFLRLTPGLEPGPDLEGMLCTVCVLAWQEQGSSFELRSQRLSLLRCQAQVLIAHGAQPPEQWPQSRREADEALLSYLGGRGLRSAAAILNYLVEQDQRAWQQKATEPAPSRTSVLQRIFLDTWDRCLEKLRVDEQSANRRLRSTRQELGRTQQELVSKQAALERVSRQLVSKQEALRQSLQEVTTVREEATKRRQQLRLGQKALDKIQRAVESAQAVRQDLQAHEKELRRGQTALAQVRASADELRGVVAALRREKDELAAQVAQARSAAAAQPVAAAAQPVAAAAQPVESAGAATRLLAGLEPERWPDADDTEAVGALRLGLARRLAQVSDLERKLWRPCCVVCLEEPGQGAGPLVVFVPCGHLRVCEGCARGLKQCPCCRAAIQGTLKPC